MVKEMIINAVIYIFLLSLIVVGFNFFKGHNSISLDSNDESMRPEFSASGYSFTPYKNMKDVKTGTLAAYYAPGNIDNGMFAYLVAKEGQKVALTNGKVYINGKVLDKPSELNGRLNIPEIIVPKGCVFLVANKEKFASLKYGPLPLRHVLGKINN